MPALIAASLPPKRFCTQSPTIKRATRNASVAPMADANDTSTVPVSTPNNAPPASVINAAPGRLNAATAT